MKDAGNDVLKAVRAALIGDAWIAGKVAQRVFSSWGNQEADHPLIRIKMPATRQYERDGGEGCELDLWVYVFTAEGAPIVCRDIAAHVRDVLDQAPLTLDDADLESIDYSDTVGPYADPQSPSLQIAILKFLVIATTK